MLKGVIFKGSGTASRRNKSLVKVFAEKIPNIARYRFLGTINIVLEEQFITPKENIIFFPPEDIARADKTIDQAVPSINLNLKQAKRRAKKRFKVLY